MSQRKTTIPAIPAVTRPSDSAEVGRSIAALREATEVGLGRRGDPLDRFVTVRDLGDSGLAKISKGGSITGPSDGIIGGIPGAPIFDPGDPDFGTEDFTKPPAPTGVAARGVGPDSIMVTWNPPGYANHAYAEVFFLTEDPSYDHMIQATPGFRLAQPVSTDNPHASFSGTATGTQYMHRDLVRLAPRPGENALDSALLPTARYYWVRFISTAGVAGPFQTTGPGALGRMTIDPGRVFDAMLANITSSEIYSNLRQFIGSSGLSQNLAEIAQQGGITNFIKTNDQAIRSTVEALAVRVGDTSWLAANETLSSVTRVNDSSIENLWSVRMNQTVGGLTYAAGFGLGLTTDAVTGRSVSTFAVNANQFAIMGTSTPAIRIARTNAASAGSTEIFLRSVIDPSRAACMCSSQGSSSVAVGTKLVLIASSSPDSPISVLNNIECEVVAIAFGLVTVKTSSGLAWPSASVTAEVGERWGLGLLGVASVPFIVDTVRNVVGIRGSLVVDGLVRAVDGDFNTLTAETAFMRTVQAEVVNANVVIGQKLIAGTPGAGAITGDALAQVSNWIIELNNPVTGLAPLRYYRPATGQIGFELSTQGDVKLAGNLSVGKNAVIATTEDQGAVFSVGGAGFDGSYALWCGARGDYGVQGEGRRESNGIFWVKQPASQGAPVRAGFNADVFLGSGALSLPSVAAQSESNPNPGADYTVDYGDGTSNTIRANSTVSEAISINPITIKADRDGRVAPTLVTVSGMLVSSGTVGGGDSKMFRLTAELVGSRSSGTTAVPGGLVQTFVQDDYTPECHPFTMSNILQVPAGNYYVRLRYELYRDKPMSIIKGWNVVAMQVGM